MGAPAVAKRTPAGFVDAAAARMQCEAQNSAKSTSAEERREMERDGRRWKKRTHDGENAIERGRTREDAVEIAKPLLSIDC